LQLAELAVVQGPDQNQVIPNLALDDVVAFISNRPSLEEAKFLASLDRTQQNLLAHPGWANRRRLYDVTLVEVCIMRALDSVQPFKKFARWLRLPLNPFCLALNGRWYLTFAFESLKNMLKPNYKFRGRDILVNWQNQSTLEMRQRRLTILRALLEMVTAKPTTKEHFDRLRQVLVARSRELVEASNVPADMHIERLIAVLHYPSMEPKYSLSSPGEGPQHFVPRPDVPQVLGHVPNAPAPNPVIAQPLVQVPDDEDEKHQEHPFQDPLLVAPIPLVGQPQPLPHPAPLAMGQAAAEADEHENENEQVSFENVLTECRRMQQNLGPVGVWQFTH